jgi:hypothetical protein
MQSCNGTRIHAKMGQRRIENLREDNEIQAQEEA